MTFEKLSLFFFFFLSETPAARRSKVVFFRLPARKDLRCREVPPAPEHKLAVRPQERRNGAAEEGADPPAA